jgi:membrane-bound lytic murein transglycosylase D
LGLTDIQEAQFVRSILTHWKRLALLSLPLIVLAGGCATQNTQGRTHHFDPVPSPVVGAKELEPASPRSTTQLLRAADRAFKEANVAQEKGDSEAALRHYKKMLELLIEADLDPVIFYSLRNEFGHILDSTNQNVHLFELAERDRWQDMNIDMMAPVVLGDLPLYPFNERVLSEVEEIKEAYPRGYQAGMNRSFRYHARIREEFAKAGLPQDLAWLAMVESQYKNTARSHAGAVGMWQFMAPTARRYGLRIDNYVDERRCWEKSTRAAVAYLGDLYRMFGEWPLAVSAYNMGEGGMGRVLASAGGEKDLFKILDSSAGQRRMHRETQKFYPRLAASIIVASAPERHGFKVEPEELPSYVRMPVKGSFSLKELDGACGLERGTLQDLNPELIRGVTPPSGEYMLAVPVDAGKRFITALASVRDDKRGPVQVASAPARSSASSSASSASSGPTSTYVVKRGDTVGALAKRFGVSQRQLMAMNNIRSAKRLYVGKRLRIPGDASAAAAPKATSYKVSRGDTLSEIADKHGVSMRDLERWNSISRSKPLRVGQKLTIVGGDAPAPAPAATKHKVRSGDTAIGIAKRHGVKLSDLLAWNGWSKRKVLQVNETYVVKGGSSGPTTITHKVARGENPTTIARKYGVSVNDLFAWNDWSKRHVLQVNEKVVIKK